MKCDLLKPFYFFRYDSEDVEGFDGGHCDLSKGLAKPVFLYVCI